MLRADHAGVRAAIALADEAFEHRFWLGNGFEFSQRGGFGSGAGVVHVGRWAMLQRHDAVGSGRGAKIHRSRPAWIRRRQNADVAGNELGGVFQRGQRLGGLLDMAKGFRRIDPAVWRRKAPGKSMKGRRWRCTVAAAMRRAWRCLARCGCSARDQGGVGGFVSSASSLAALLSLTLKNQPALQRVGAGQRGSLRRSSFTSTHFAGHGMYTSAAAPDGLDHASHHPSGLVPCRWRQIDKTPRHLPVRPGRRGDATRWRCRLQRWSHIPWSGVLDRRGGNPSGGEKRIR